MFCKICGTGYGKMIMITENDETIYVCKDCYEELYEESASENTFDDCSKYDIVRLDMNVLEERLGKGFFGEYREYITSDELMDFLNEGNTELTIQQKCTIAHICGYADSYKDTCNGIIKAGYDVFNEREEMMEELKGKILS